MTIRLLILDDNPHDRYLMKRLLNNYGEFSYTFEEVEEGALAIQLCQQHIYDCILLDYQLTDMDGLSFVEQLKQAKPSTKIPVVMLTGQGSEAIAVQALKQGIQDYLIKDVLTAENLYRAIQNAMSWAAMSRQIEEQHQELERKTRELQALNASKDRFLSLLSHDLRAPFTGVRGIVSVLRAEFSQLNPEELQAFLEQLDVTVTHVYNLLENLLTWSRLQFNQVPWHPISIEVERLVQEALLVLRPVAEKKQIHLEINAGPPLAVRGDYSMLRSLLQNLVSNALKFTAAGGRVQVAWETQKDWGTLTVKDTGVGMSKMELNGLFRLDTYRTTYGTEGERGSGLGLLLCQEFIEKNQGKIWAESEKNQGTTFYVLLPRESQNENAQSLASSHNAV